MLCGSAALALPWLSVAVLSRFSSEPVGRPAAAPVLWWSIAPVCRFNVFPVYRRAGVPVGVRRKGTAHRFERCADNSLVMRHLFWTLASLDCQAATWLTAAGRPDTARRLVERAGELLEARARSRADDEPWKPVLDRSWTRRE